MPVFREELCKYILRCSLELSLGGTITIESLTTRCLDVAVNSVAHLIVSSYERRQAEWKEQMILLSETRSHTCVQAYCCEQDVFQVQLSGQICSFYSTNPLQGQTLRALQPTDSILQRMEETT